MERILARDFNRCMVVLKDEIDDEYFFTESDGSKSFLFLKYAQDKTGCKQIKVSLQPDHIVERSMMSSTSRIIPVYYITVEYEPVKL